MQVEHNLARNRDLLPYIRNNDLHSCVCEACFLIMPFCWAFLCQHAENDKGMKKMEAGEGFVTLVHFGHRPDDSGLSNL